MRTHVKNSLVGVMHCRAKISAGPDPATLRAASLPEGRVWPIAYISGAWAVVVFSGAYHAQGLRAGMKLFGS